MANDDRYDLRLPAEEKTLFERAAEAEGMPLSLWLRRVARAAARKLLGEHAAEKKGRR